METIYVIGVVITFFGFLAIGRGFLSALINAVLWPVGWIYVLIIKKFIAYDMRRK